MIVGVLTTFHTQYTWYSTICVFYKIGQNNKVLFHTLQLLYMCTPCDSRNINTIIEFVRYVSGDGFNGSYNLYLQFQDTHAPCLLKLCTTPSNGIVRLWLFPEFGAEMPLDSCTPTIILNKAVHNRLWLEYSQIKTVGCFRWTASVSWVPLIADCYLLWGVNLYQAQNSRLPRVTGLHVINVAAVIEF